MKFIFLLLFCLTWGDYQHTDTVDLKILVTNINTLKGSIELGVFNNSKTFLKKGGEYKTYSQKVTGDTIIFYLNGLKKDDYAITIYHDINSDNKCNMSFWGIPSEPYGFSRNFKPKYSKPSFDDCKINTCGTLPITISLIRTQL